MNDWEDNSKELEDEPSEDSGSSNVRSPMLVRSLLMGLGALSLIGIGASGVYYGVKQRPEWFGVESKGRNEELVQAEIQSLVDEIGKIIDLPQDETPTLATVSDMEKVKEQQFFARAQNGDKVLVYQNAKKAYLYRPTEKKIIEVGVVNVSEKSGQVTGDVAGDSAIVVTPTKAVTPTQKPN